jgi:hypothetical protein
MQITSLTVTALPQPGTTNTPTPSIIPPLSAFVPVTFNSVDTDAADIAAFATAMTTAMATRTTQLRPTLILIDTNTQAILTTITSYALNLYTLSSQLKQLETSLGGMISQQANQNALTAINLANQIKTNGFKNSERDEKPTMPPPEDQIKAAFKDSVAFSTGGAGVAFVVSQVQSGFVGMVTYTTQSAAYKTLAGWFDSALTSITTPIKSVWTTLKEKITRFGLKE